MTKKEILDPSELVRNDRRSWRDDELLAWISRNSAMMPFNRCEESTFALQILSPK
jgi:hypothetical protein